VTKVDDPAGESPTARTARLIREQADGCAVMGSPLYANLLRHAADDVLAGGPTRRLLDGHLEDPGPSALALRMMGGVHALVLGGSAPRLAAYYPSVTADPADPGADGVAAWAALAEVLDTERETLRPWLSRPPQTNEVGRATALLGGLAHLVTAADLPVRLIEIGTSAGLNLRADHFHVDGIVARYGDPSSPVRLRGGWLGVPPPSVELEVIERAGGDLTPIDPTIDAGRLTLLAYVWPDQRERVARLHGALELAARIPADVRAEPAEATLHRTELADGAWTVVWHSVFWQYLDGTQRRAAESRIAALGAAADGSARFAHLSLEPRRRTPASGHEFLVTMTAWPGGEERILGVAHPHGVPTTWEAAASRARPG
jgi:hypothetical protein